MMVILVSSMDYLSCIDGARFGLDRTTVLLLLLLAVAENRKRK